MNFASVADQLRQAIQEPLPGPEARTRLSPGGRPRQGPPAHKRPRQAAVLALVENRGETPYLLFIERPPYDGVHGGQIAFPGGKVEPADLHIAHTALRETEEEIGAAPSQIELLGALTELYIPPSDFQVYPFLGLAAQPLALRRQKSEVAQIHRIPLPLLQDQAAFCHTTVATRKESLRVPAYQAQGVTIWGATAMILCELLALLPAVPPRPS
ncbi:MAG: CoA pyrophosphatase [Schleiferiaceae bacterium]|nr:CoA pyrophosphatase [Schleiferiaceae bacterium]